jgi:hypothetical protein
MAELK